VEGIGSCGSDGEAIARVNDMRRTKRKQRRRLCQARKKEAVRAARVAQRAQDVADRLLGIQQPYITYHFDGLPMIKWNPVK
jgi:hypothetical protein